MFSLDQCPPEVRELKYNADKLDKLITDARENWRKMPLDAASALCNARGCVAGFTNPVKRGNLYAAPATIEEVKQNNWYVIDAIRQMTS